MQKLAHAVDQSMRSTALADREKAEHAVINYYGALALPNPSFAWFQSPAEALAFEAEHRTRVDMKRAMMGLLATHRNQVGEFSAVATGVTVSSQHFYSEDVRVQESHNPDWRPVGALRSISDAGQTADHWRNVVESWHVGERSGHPHRRNSRVSFRNPLRSTIMQLFPGWFDNSDYDLAGLEILAHCHGGLYFDDFAFMIERPWRIETNEDGQLHSEDGPALAYRDGARFWMIKGVIVDKRTVLNPRSIRPDDIDNERNAERRRIMLERMGYERYINTQHAVLMGEDRYGKLWHRGGICVVEVVNASPEPDGSFKTYFLPVPPTMRTAHEAVAWTFGKTPATYDPLVET